MPHRQPCLGRVQIISMATVFTSDCIHGYCVYLRLYPWLLYLPQIVSMATVFTSNCIHGYCIYLRLYPWLLYLPQIVSMVTVFTSDCEDPATFALTDSVVPHACCFTFLVNSGAFAPSMRSTKA